MIKEKYNKIAKYSPYASIVLGLIFFLIVAITVFGMKVGGGFKSLNDDSFSIEAGFWKLNNDTGVTFSVVGYIAVVLLIINCVLAVVGLFHSEGRTLKTSVTLMLIAVCMSFVCGIIAIVGAGSLGMVYIVNTFFTENGEMNILGIVMITVLSLLACSSIALCAYDVFKKYLSKKANSLNVSHNQIVAKYSPYASIALGLIFFLIVAITVFGGLHLNAGGSGSSEGINGFWKLNNDTGVTFSVVGYIAVVLLIINCVLAVVGLFHSEGRILKTSVALMLIVVCMSFVCGIGEMPNGGMLGENKIQSLFYVEDATKLNPVGIAMITILSLLACSGIALCAYSVFKKYFTVRTKKVA